MFKVMFVLGPEELAFVERRMKGIRAVDSEFLYKIVQLDDGNYLLVVYSDSEDEAFRKGMWIRDKVFGNDRFFRVRKV